MESLLELFVHVDDFCQLFLPIYKKHLLAMDMKQRQRARSLTLSEFMTIMTILIHFHQSHYRNFKAYH